MATRLKNVQNAKDKSPKIFVYDDLNPEDCAMLQALYSRSPASVSEHIDKVRNAGSGNFMEKYYVGYGHASIGDCGTTTVFIENYSMLVAKAIQDNPLYSGQEASTRYLDFSVQPMHDPFNTNKTKAILGKWMDLYYKWLPIVTDSVARDYPFEDGKYKSEKIWQNAIKARGFDIMRGFLPVGTTTLLSWTTNLRQARDRLMHLKSYPLPEVRDMAETVFKHLHKKYPNSFNGHEMDHGVERYQDRDAYAERFAIQDNFQSVQDLIKRYELSPEEVKSLKDNKVIVRNDLIDIEGLNTHEKETIKLRPKGGALPRRLVSYGSYTFIFAMDFGSYRDLQRHRGGLCPLPLINGQLEMSKWYMNELENLLPEQQFREFKADLDAQLASVEALRANVETSDPLLLQYFYPMGINIPVSLTYSLPQAVYVAELRAMKTVHGSLRPIAQQMGDHLKKSHPDIALYIDYAQDNWSAKRGEQTISVK